jgi:glycosyltransferase involved in cell wall biosynthesis
MEQKKILIVSRSFYPENSPRSFRATELAKEFCREGHQVTVYTFRKEQHHAPLERAFGMVVKDLGKPIFKTISLAPGSKLSFLVRRVLNRVLLMLFEYPDIELMFKVKKVLKNESGYDLLVSNAVPHPVHWGVAAARSAKHPIATTWIADCGDGYMLEKMHDTFNKLFYFKYFEKKFCRKADYISIPTLSVKGNYYPEFHSKIIEIPQGFKFEDVEVVANAPANKVPTFAFAGVFMKGTRNPSSFVECLLKSGRDFKFIVYTQNSSLLGPYLPALKDKIEIRNYVPRLQLLKELSQMDFVVNIGYDPKSHVPSKLIDYSLTGRPILCFNGDDLDENMVHEFLDGNYNRAFQYPDLDKYRIENVCKAFLNKCQ